MKILMLWMDVAEIKTRRLDYRARSPSHSRDLTLTLDPPAALCTFYTSTSVIKTSTDLHQHRNRSKHYSNDYEIDFREFESSTYFKLVKLLGLSGRVTSSGDILGHRLIEHNVWCTGHLTFIEVSMLLRSNPSTDCPSHEAQLFANLESLI